MNATIALESTSRLSEQLRDLIGKGLAGTVFLTTDDFWESYTAMKERGVEFVEVTLHVGAGTFLPVKVEDVTSHRMHAEWGEVTPTAAARITASRSTSSRRAARAAPPPPRR